MIEDLNITLIAGGYEVCDNSWDKLQTEIDKCYKLYLPVKGCGHIILDGKTKDIEAGKIYLFSGYRLERQYCEDELDVYWAHFIPESLQLQHFLSQIEPFHSWPTSMNPFGDRIYSTIKSLFKPDKKTPQENRFIFSALVCEINALILHIIADLLEHAEVEIDYEKQLEIEKIKPSIDFIESHIYQPLKLEDIAGKSSISTSYFHFKFKKLFKVTPLEYILERRISTARKLLATTDLPIKDVAFRLGYANEFYFSRVFKKEMGMSPSEFRESGSSL